MSPAPEVEILGVNLFSAGGGTSLMVAGRVLPLLQDTQETNAWGAWGAELDDVIVLDRENRLVTVYNLAANNLATAANYNALMQILLDAAAAP